MSTCRLHDTTSDDLGVDRAPPSLTSTGAGGPGGVSNSVSFWGFAQGFLQSALVSGTAGRWKETTFAIGMREIPCPSGPGETVTNVTDSVTAVDPVGEEYEYRVDYRYSISYL